MKNNLTLLVFLLAMAGCTTSSVVLTDVPTKPGPKNIVLLIGDGMGLSQISAGIYANGNTANFEKIRTVGIQKPYASDNLITDSAAGATALSCGRKTYNGAIAVDPDTIAIRTILEEAESRGLATGLVATSSIVHATPASFIAHNKSRLNYEQIAADFLKTDIDFFVGGGKNYFANRQSDDRNLIDELKAKGYYVEDFINTEINRVRLNPEKKFAFFTANTEPLPSSQGRNYLEDASVLALSFLEQHSKAGFFLMIEGSQIDWGGHANNVDYVISEWKEFDRVIGRVLEWSRLNGETLVIITSDHETGGLAIQPQSTMDNIIASFSSDYHTGAMVPVFADGPKEELFNGIYENTEIYFKMRKAFGW